MAGKSFMLNLQNFLRTTNAENFSSIGKILLKISFLKGKITRFGKTSFKLMVKEIVKIKLRHLNLRFESVKNQTSIFFSEF